MAESLAETVTRLLQASRAAHDRAKTARQQKQTFVAVDELTAARNLRVEAHDADPEHTAPAWATETPSHAAMMDFYIHKLGA
jgi:hypothetical protein